MNKNIDRSFFASSELDGRVDENQFYEESTIGKDIGFIYWGDGDKISINLNYIE